MRDCRDHPPGAIKTSPWRRSILIRGKLWRDIRVLGALEGGSALIAVTGESEASTVITLGRSCGLLQGDSFSKRAKRRPVVPTTWASCFGTGQRRVTAPEGAQMGKSMCTS